MAFSDVSSVENFFATPNEGFTTTTSSSVSAGATNVGLNSVANLTNGSVFVGVIEPGESKEQIFTGTVDTGGSQITNVKWIKGTNTDHATGVTVVDYDTGAAFKMLSTGIQNEHNQDGTHDEALITARATDSTPADGDFILTADVSASNALKKTTRSSLFRGGAVLKDVRTYTSNDTWTKPTGLAFIIVEVQGGGGGGGAGALTSTIATGGGGGGGGYALAKVAAASLGATETVTVGSGGSGGSSGSGSPGGTSSFGSHAVATGGGGGTARSGVGVSTSAAGGVGTAGDFLTRGQPGQQATIIDADSGYAGSGGGSFFGAGGKGDGTNTAGDSNGNSGIYGGGGSGGINDDNTTDSTGGAGGSGLVRVWEYF